MPPFMNSFFRCSAVALLVVVAGCAQPVKPAPAPVAPAPVAPVITPVAGTADAPVVPPSAEKIEAFIAETAKSSGMPAEQVRDWLSQARYQQSIINAITRPAEGKPWKDYRPIFLTETRISQGRAFYAEHP